jgi:hypothetical protein
MGGEEEKRKDLPQRARRSTEVTEKEDGKNQPQHSD